MDAAIAQLVEQMSALRADAERRDATLRADAERRDAAAVARDAALRAEVAALRPVALDESPSAPSYAVVGSEALLVLEKACRISVAVEPSSGTDAVEGAPVASPDDLARLRACATERELVAAITPLLRAARGFDEAHAAAEADPCARVLVNSERVAWLDSLSTPLPADQLKKPDLFATWTPFWLGSADPARGAYGRLAARALQLDGCTREFYEAKVGVGELTVSDFGQLVDYHSRVRGPVRGALFNARAFWLYESVRSHPVGLTKCEWGARGSRVLLRAFFNAVPEPPLVPLLRHLCRELRVEFRRVNASGLEPPDGSDERASAFLGAGGSARVFCVAAKGSTDAPFALKASTMLSRADLEYEFTTLQRAANAGAPVVPVVPGSLVFFFNAAGEHGGGGFLLRDVCTRAVLDTPARCTAAFAALRALHAAGFAHGDARLPNLLTTRAHGAGAELRWIDLREAAVVSLASAQRADARALAASVLKVAQGGALSARIELALDNVPGDGDAAYAALAAAVWAAY